MLLIRRSMYSSHSSMFSLEFHRQTMNYSNFRVSFRYFMLLNVIQSI